MKNQEIINKLNGIKDQVTKLGFEHLNNLIPVPVDSAVRALSPFQEIENVINEQISNLEKRGDNLWWV